MCVPGLTSATVAAVAGKKNDREAHSRKQNAATVDKKRATARTSKINTRKKQAISSFTSNVATGGQNRAANKGA
jgi:hypothetical protein